MAGNGDFLQNNTVLQTRYKIIRLIRSGGMSNIYEVHDDRLGKSWALKELCLNRFSPKDRVEMMELFQRESMILSKLPLHPGLPAIADCFRENNNYYLIMTFINGENLEDFVQDPRNNISVKKILQWAIEICDIINMLHSQKPPVLYRDLKPANIMITPEGKIILVDFGIAGWLRAAQKLGQTQNLTIALGTPGFAPPEQYSGKTDMRSDVYSLGVTLHCLFSGINPEKNDNPFDFQNLSTLRPEIPKNISEIIHKALNHNPDKRYQTMENFNQVLEKVIGSQNHANTYRNLSEQEDNSDFDVFGEIEFIFRQLKDCVTKLYTFKPIEIDNLYSLYCTFKNYFSEGLIQDALQVSYELIEIIEDKKDSGSFELKNFFNYVFKQIKEFFTLSDEPKKIDNNPLLAMLYLCRSRIYVLLNKKNNAFSCLHEAISYAPQYKILFSELQRLTGTSDINIKKLILKKNKQSKQNE